MRRLVLLALLAACNPRREAPQPEAQPPVGVPVVATQVQESAIAATVGGQGETVALAQQKVRAPFRSQLVDLLVTDGDRVRADQVLGHVISEDSLAAVTGARAMLAAAASPADRVDAERALSLAEQNLVKAPIHSPVSGVVVAHTAAAGSLVAADEGFLLTLAAEGSIVFVANIVQSDLPAVHSGLKASVDLPARGTSLAGTVHGILPAASAKDLTSPVRIDFAQAVPLATGLFGTASIVVAQHPHALVVPSAAVIRNDISGGKSVATVDASRKAHWVTVETGLTQKDLVEVSNLPVGTLVITSGQVGLPEGAALQVRQVNP